MSHLNFSWYFLPIFALLKVTGLVILFDSKLQKLNHFWHFIELLPTQNINVARSQCWMRLFLWFSNTVEMSKALVVYLFSSSFKNRCFFTIMTMFGLFKVGSHLGKRFSQWGHDCAGALTWVRSLRSFQWLRILLETTCHFTQLDFVDKLADALVKILPWDVNGKDLVIVFN